MLGEDLPGANSVINSVSLKYHMPVPIGKTYFTRSEQLSLAVKGFVLDLRAKIDGGGICVSGTSTCNIPKEEDI